MRKRVETGDSWVGPAGGGGFGAQVVPYSLGNWIVKTTLGFGGIYASMRAALCSSGWWQAG